MMFYIKYNYGGLEMEDKQTEYTTYQEAYDVAKIQQKIFNNYGTAHKLNFKIIKIK